VTAFVTVYVVCWAHFTFSGSPVFISALSIIPCFAGIFNRSICLKPEGLVPIWSF
jgi:hypothetical protein